MQTIPSSAGISGRQSPCFLCRSLGRTLDFFLYKNLNASIPGIFRVLSVLRGRAGFPVKSRLLPPQSRHRAPLECCTAAHGTACERSRSAGRFSGDPFVRRVRACRSPRPRSGCRARRVRSWAPSACSSRCHNSPINFSCMP